MADSSRSSKSSTSDVTAAGGAMLLRERALEIEAGSVLAGRYQIRRVVGKGATGVVVEADDRVTKSLVAIKIFKPEITPDDRWQEIVGSELRHARKLQHPNVCRVFDAGEADGYRFLTMEFASGGSLRERLAKAGAARPMDERIVDARAVVDGLAAIHERGIIHRDVKPDNVLRLEDGRLVVTDFGLAMAPGQNTFFSGYSGAVGTPTYMAPEVAMGEAATMASDVFSLGVVLHEIFFGRRPEWDVTKRGRFLKSPLGKKATRIERSVARLCDECLQELPPRRIQDAREVQKRFARAVLGRYGMMVGALRAGRWGIAAGVGLAMVGVVVTVVVTRPDDGIVEAEITGTPEDWTSKARLLAEREGPVHCLEALPGGKAVRVVWGAPKEVVDIDISSGAAVPAPLLPETYRDGCPSLSPDGGALAFAVLRPVRTIMLSENPLGRDAGVVSSGAGPLWLPRGRELMFASDLRRAVLFTPWREGRPLPDLALPEGKLFSGAVSLAGNRITLIYGLPERKSQVVEFDTKSHQILRNVLVPGEAWHLLYPEVGNELFLVLRERPAHVVARLLPDGRLVRQGAFASAEVSRMVRTPLGIAVAIRMETWTLYLQRGAGSELLLAKSRFIGNPSFSPAGSLMTWLELADGSRVVARLAPSNERLETLTVGPRDENPIEAPDGSWFVYHDGAHHEVKECTLDRVSRCRVLADEVLFQKPILSPDGNYIAYGAESPTGHRLRLVARTTGEVTDLGPASPECPVRWRSPTRLQVFQREGRTALWREVNLSGKATGSTELVVDARSPCPDPALPAGVQYRIEKVVKSRLLLTNPQAL